MNIDPFDKAGRKEAINTINATHPITDHPSTGRKLLGEALIVYTLDSQCWRTLPTEVLIECAKLCEGVENEGSRRMYGLRAKNRRKELGISRRKLAEMLNCSEKFLAKIEGRMIGEDELQNFVETWEAFLNVPSGWLTDDTVDAKSLEETLEKPPLLKRISRLVFSNVNS